jgi:hypothetical protein
MPPRVVFLHEFPVKPKLTITYIAKVTHGTGQGELSSMYGRSPRHCPLKRKKKKKQLRALFVDLYLEGAKLSSDVEART